MMSQLVFAIFSLFDDIVSISCLLWLCWQFPLVGRRPVRAFFIFVAVLFVPPLIIALGRSLPYFALGSVFPGYFSNMFVWGLLWNVTAIPYVVLVMLWIRRVTGIVVTRERVVPAFQRLGIGDLFLWTFVAAVGFACIGIVKNWLTSALMAMYGESYMSGASMMGYAAYQAVVYGAVVFLLLPNLRSSIWLRALVAYVVYLLARVGMIMVYYSLHSGTQSPGPPLSYWIEMVLTTLSSVLGILVAYRIFQRRGYEFHFRPKASLAFEAGSIPAPDGVVKNAPPD